VRTSNNEEELLAAGRKRPLPAQRLIVQLLDRESIVSSEGSVTRWLGDRRAAEICGRLSLVS
jgi:hypothetical protein